MSKLLIDPKILSWGDTYYIYDLLGNIEYRVIGVIFSISRMEILFEKKIGREKGMIRRRFFRLFKTYEIQIGRKPQGTVKKRYFFLRPRYILDFRGWRIEGDIEKLEYSIYDNSTCVANITKNPSKQGDAYVLDIQDEQDEIPAIMAAIAIYKARGRKKN